MGTLDQEKEQQQQRHQQQQLRDNSHDTDVANEAEACDGGEATAPEDLNNEQTPPSSPIPVPPGPLEILLQQSRRFRCFNFYC